MLSIHMTSMGRISKEVSDCVKKVERVKRDSQTTVLAKRAKNSSFFQGSYARGSSGATLAAKAIKSAMPVSTDNYSGNPSNNFLVDQSVGHVVGSRTSGSFTCFSFGEHGYMMRN